MEGEFIINGKRKVIQFENDDLLLDVLRNNGYKEVKCGCREGTCGSCVVILDEKLVNSCQVFAATATGKKIITSKGLGDIKNPHKIHKALVDAGAVQCGFCTPGMVLAIYYLLKEEKNPDEEKIKEYLDGNLCRCTGYEKIIEAVKSIIEGKYG
jgi:aerobic-type carbon monoxide dehydrogenase small subunit (CoxS/CutS family)|uniref:(2Fe-2S)-binding protein n=1 Tax=candidate division WOR-3 bacterium TaxID=2052148 RepID=A0A7C4Y6Y4_UNCW3